MAEAKVGELASGRVRRSRWLLLLLSPLLSAAGLVPVSKVSPAP
jgi:hypothetical protein